MERAMLNEIGFKTRNEALDFLKRLWQQEIARCPICGSDLELLHGFLVASDYRLLEKEIAAFCKR